MPPISNLFARIAFNSPGINLPIVIIVHGWNQIATDFDAATFQRIADYGFLVSSVGMRGRNGADGARDASAREIYDIADLVRELRAAPPAGISVSLDKAAVVGYSGGGGNALACASKFPDLFNVVVSHFGMSDYGRNNPNGWWYNAPGAYPAEIAASVGGVPAALPNDYYARDSTAAIGNFTGGYLMLFHDETDGTVPPIHSHRIVTELTGFGLTNYYASFTNVGDSPRWLHGLPADNPDLILAEPLWRDEIFNRPAWTVPASSTMTVIGYLVTKRFIIWLRTTGVASWGIDAVATVTYGVIPDTYRITPLTAANIDATVEQLSDGKTGSANNFGIATDIVVA